MRRRVSTAAEAERITRSVDALFRSPADLHRDAAAYAFYSMIEQLGISDAEARELAEHAIMCRSALGRRN